MMMMMMNTLHKLLLQHVNFPTRSRGNDTPHILDLVITDSQLIHNIDTLARGTYDRDQFL